MTDKPAETSFAQQAKRIPDYATSSEACDDLRLMYGKFEELYNVKNEHRQRHLHSLSAAAVEHAKKVCDAHTVHWFG